MIVIVSYDKTSLYAIIQLHKKMIARVGMQTDIRISLMANFAHIIMQCLDLQSEIYLQGAVNDQNKHSLLRIAEQSGIGQSAVSSVGIFGHFAVISISTLGVTLL